MIETSDPNEYPACFGKLEQVFPMGPDGLRHSPESCFFCHYKTECLRTALADENQGLKVHEEMVDRAYDSGMMGFFQRWSKRKALKQKQGKSKP